jgi:hypothetical protein
MKINTKLLFSLTGILMLSNLAYAADPVLPTTTGSISIDLTTVCVAIVSGVFSTVAIIIPIILQKYVKNVSMRSLLNEAVKNSLGKLQIATDAEITVAAILHPDVPKAIAPAVKYVIDHAQDALTYFNITPQSIADKISAKLGLTNIEHNLAATASSGHGVPPLAAVLPIGRIPNGHIGIATAEKATISG